MANPIISGLVETVKNAFGNSSQAQTTQEAAAAVIQSESNSKSASQNTRPTPGRGNYGSTDERRKSEGAQALITEIETTQPKSASGSGNILQDIAKENKPDKTVTEAMRDNSASGIENTIKETTAEINAAEKNTADISRNPADYSKWLNQNVDWETPKGNIIEKPQAATNDGGIFNDPVQLVGTVAGLGVAAKVAPAVISKLPAVGKEAAKAGATITGFGSFAGAGGETEISKQTTEFSSELKEISSGLNSKADTGLEKIGAFAAGFGLGVIGGTVDTIGGITSAGKGIIDVAKETQSKGIAAGFEKLSKGFETTISGLENWVKEIPNNAAYSAGEFVGFGKTYNTISKTPKALTTTLGKEAGLIDSRIVDSGDIIVSKNPLLTAAVASGAVESGGLLRLDSAPRVTLTDSGIKTLDNIGSRIEVKTQSGKELFVAGRSNPLSPIGEIDLSRSQREYSDIAKQEGVPFIYGTEQFGKAGTYLGILDRSPNYLSSKLTREAVNAVLPIDLTVRTGRVLSYEMKNPVSFGETVTPSAKAYTPDEMTNAYNALSGNLEKIISSDEFKNDVGLTPTLTPKQAAGLYRDIAESEHAWGNAANINARFKTKSFGGFTTTGLPITKLGSEQSLFSTLRENRAANKNIVQNPFVRSSDGILDLNKGQADVIDYFTRDASFRLAEIIGKPSALNDITDHGSLHVENVAKIARELKYQNPAKYGKVSDREIYFAGILHDISKNTARDSVPGGHGEMVGSIILRGSSLDARSYLRPEAVKEFENILGKAGTEKYNTFLEEFGKLTPAEKHRIASAVTHHTTNLKGIFGQTHRLTESKLGQLISDADRLELRRFSDNPESFKPKQRLMFTNKNEQAAAIKNVFGTQSKVEAGLSKPSRQAFKAAPEPTRNPYRKIDTTPLKGYIPTPKPKESIGYVTPTKPSTYKFDNPPKNTFGGYQANNKGKSYGIRGSGSDSYSTIGKALKLADLEITPKKRKKEDVLDDFGNFRKIKLQRIDHFGIYDPLEFVGAGSLTKRNRPELTTKKGTIYEVNGGYTSRKPKGKGRR